MIKLDMGEQRPDKPKIRCVTQFVPWLFCGDRVELKHHVMYIDPQGQLDAVDQYALFDETDNIIVEFTDGRYAVTSMYGLEKYDVGVAAAARKEGMV